MDRQQKTLVRLDDLTLHEAQVLERSDLQEMICKNPQAFVDELDEDIWIVGAGVRPEENFRDEIDVLGVDAEGTAVVIELKRARHRLQLLQAASYAGMIAGWDAEAFVQCLQQYICKYHKPATSLSDARKQLSDYLGGSLEDVNSKQRLVLVAEAFDFALLRAAEWLAGRHGVDIRCYKLETAKDGDNAYVTLVCVFPPTDPEQEGARGRDTPTGATINPVDWEGMISALQTPALAEFVRRLVAFGAGVNPSKGRLRIYRNGRGRWRVYVKRRHVYVVQTGRFSGDTQFWLEKLGPGCEPKEIDKGARLRLKLRQEDELKGFLAVTLSPDPLKSISWESEPGAETEEDDELAGEST